MTNLQKTLAKLSPQSKIILSIDLDYTLVDRSISGNYILPSNKKLLQKLNKNKNITILANTGRELYGFNSFVKQGFPLKNGIFASGRVVRFNNTDFFNSNSVINNNLLTKLINLVNTNKIKFLDIAYFNERTIIYKELSDLFFSQNPKDWFSHSTYPKTEHVKNYINNKEIYRIEFPVFANEKMYKYINLNTKELKEKFIELYNIDPSFKDLYSLKKKKHYSKIDKNNDFLYLRIERISNDVGKGIGILKWLKHSNLNENDRTIIHIGDQDHGLINDTEVKIAIPKSILLMVGTRCNPQNKLFDLYVNKDSNLGVKQIFEQILKKTNTTIKSK